MKSTDSYVGSVASTSDSFGFRKLVVCLSQLDRDDAAEGTIDRLLSVFKLVGIDMLSGATLWTALLALPDDLIASSIKKTYSLTSVTLTKRDDDSASLLIGLFDSKTSQSLLLYWSVAETIEHATTIVTISKRFLQFPSEVVALPSAFRATDIIVSSISLSDPALNSVFPSASAYSLDIIVVDSIDEEVVVIRGLGDSKIAEADQSGFMFFYHIDSSRSVFKTFKIVGSECNQVVGSKRVFLCDTEAVGTATMPENENFLSKARPFIPSTQLTTAASRADVNPCLFFPPT